MSELTEEEYAEGIAEARREGAAEVEDRVAAFLPSWVPDLDPWFLRELRAALRGDA